MSARAPMTADHHTGDRSPVSQRSWARGEGGCQRALLHHFAGSPLAEAAPVDAPVRWVRTGVASNIHNGVARTRLCGDDADEAIAATLRTLAGCPAIWHLDSD